MYEHLYHHNEPGDDTNRLMARAEATFERGRKLRLPVRRPIRNLGQVAGMLLLFHEGCMDLYDDPITRTAPSECLPLIHRGQLREARHLRRRLEHLAGAPKREILRQLERRCDGRWLHMRGLNHAADMVLGKGQR